MWVLIAAPGKGRLAVFLRDCYALGVFGIGYLELMVLALLIILLFPPRELPKLARTAARAYGSIRKVADDFHRTVLLDEDLRQPLDEIRGAYDEARWDIRRTGDRMKQELRSARDDAKAAVSPAAATAAPGDSLSEDAAMNPEALDAAYQEQDHLPYESGDDDYEDEYPPGAFESSEMPPPRQSLSSPLVQRDHPALEGRVAAPESGAEESAASQSVQAILDEVVREESLEDVPVESPEASRPSTPIVEPSGVDESALTRVTRLPMPPSLKEGSEATQSPSNSDGAPKQA